MASNSTTDHPILDPGDCLRHYLDSAPDDTRAPILHIVYAGDHPDAAGALVIPDMHPMMAAAVTLAQDPDRELITEFALMNEIWIATEMTEEEIEAGITPGMLAERGDPRARDGAICTVIWNGGNASANAAFGDDGWAIKVMHESEAMSPVAQMFHAMGEMLVP